MLKKMILINSANFQFADIDLSKEIFFVGDNASGKTTTTRALHFLYNGDGQKLGIPNSKDTFAQHYFPDDDSYIIYVFESFFIFTYKRNNTIKRWFSKQEFNVHKIFRNNNKETVEFKEIENYIKEASLKRKPETIEEYTSILYGNSSKYLDFSIAKISNTKIFLDIFNMIFNIDKAIVTARDIKEAIQKSLDRKDEVLNIDYDDFIRKLNSYSKSYHFFKTFDKSRISLKDALELKDELLSLEKDEKTKRSEIAYRFPLEVAELNTLADSIFTISQSIATYKKRTSSIESMYSKYNQRVSIKIKKLEKEVIKLEALKEKFDPLDVEENTTIANQHDGIKKELNDKNFSLNKLKEAQTTAEQEIETQIEQIVFKIDKTIPNEMRQNFFKLNEEEKATHQSIVYEIEGEYEKLRYEVDLEIIAIENIINTINESIASINSNILKEQEVIKEEYRSKLTAAQTQKQNHEHNADLADKTIKRMEGLKQEQKSKISEHEKRYVKLRRDNAKILASKRVSLNKKIANARAIVNPPVNSFNAFLSSEVDGWEQSIYPIIDKDLLKLSYDELQPEILDAESPLGFKINTDSLASMICQHNIGHF